MSSYEYRKERFRKMKDAWQFEKMHDLLIHKMPPENLLNELRFSIMLYISKAFYFDFTTEEDEFVRSLAVEELKRLNIDIEEFLRKNASEEDESKEEVKKQLLQEDKKNVKDK